MHKAFVLFGMYFFLKFIEAFDKKRMFLQAAVVLEKPDRRASRLFDEFDVLEPPHRDIGQAGLFLADEFARTADFQILFRELKSVFRFENRFQPFAGRG